MKISKKRAVGVAVLLVGLLAGGYYVENLRFKRSFGAAMEKYFSEHELPAPDAKGWERLKVGMTKPEVASLLGAAPIRVGAEGKEGFWAYGYMFTVPVEHPSAYIVRFDGKGVVASFRIPDTTR
jgi:hypothetical protein